MEKLIRGDIVDHMAENNFNPEQQGFINEKSCTTQLLEFLEDLTEALYAGNDVDVIYLDFQKAFDKVLLKKMGLWYPRYNPLLDPRFSQRWNTNSISGRQQRDKSQGHKWNFPG